MKNIKYSDVVKLGFERYEMNDKIFLDSHGYDDFFMELKFGKYNFNWSNENDFVTLQKMKGYNILSTLRIYNLSELKTLVSFFKGKDYHSSIFDLNKPNNDICHFA